MTDRFARCPNTDYCSLGDRRAVMRLDVNEPFFCPECAHALVSAPPWGQRRMPWPALGAAAMGGAAIAAGFLAAERWPHAMAGLMPARFVSAPMTAGQPGAAPAPTAAMPDPARLFMAVAMDDYLPRSAGDRVLRPRRMRPPRSDPMAVEARAALEAGVPSVAWPAEYDLPESMPWRQALIMAALITPGPLGAAPAPVVPPVVAPAAAPSLQPPAGLAPPSPAPPSPVEAPEAPPERTRDRSGIRPQAVLIPPALVPPALVPPALIPPARPGAAERKAETMLTDGLLRRNTSTQIDLASLVVAMPETSSQQMRIAPATPPPPVPSGIPPILRAPVAPPAIVTPPPAPVAAAPNRMRVANAAPRKAAPGAMTALKATARTHVAAKAPPASHKLKVPQAAPPPETAAAPAQAAAPAVAADISPGLPPGAAQGNGTAADAPEPPAKVVRMVPGLGMTYGPLKDINLSSIVIPARPSSDKPQRGSLKVDCVIDTNGMVSNCRVLRAEKAAAVSDGLLAWLGSGLVHRAPTIKDGRPIRARQIWTLDFPAESQR